MTAYVIFDDCVPQDLYLCVHDQCSRTVASVKAKLHLMLRSYYTQLHPHNLLLIVRLESRDPWRQKHTGWPKK